MQITTDTPAEPKKSERIAKNIRLAERLGAKVISKISGDKTLAVLEAIDEYGITELVMTRPKSRFFGLLFPNLTKSVMSKNRITLETILSAQSFYLLLLHSVLSPKTLSVLSI